jgi:hypothetical protein
MSTKSINRSRRSSRLFSSQLTVHGSQEFVEVVEIAEALEIVEAVKTVKHFAIRNPQSAI